MFQRLRHLFFRQLFHNQREELLLNAVLDEDVPEPSDCIPVRHLIAGLYFAEIRKSTAVNDFVVRCTEVRLRRTPRIRAQRELRVVPQIVTVLQYINPKHQPERIGLVSASTLLVVVRFHQFGEISPRHDPVDLFEKFFLVRLCFLQLVAQEGHVQLFVHEIIIPQMPSKVQPLFALYFVRGCLC